MSIGKRIKKYRREAGYSQKELAELLFLGERTIGHYETEKRQPPLDKLEMLADALDVDVTDLTKRSRKDMEAWGDYFFYVGKGSKKNMDERRFRLIMKRVFYFKKFDFEEEDDFIEVDDSLFSKKLADTLLPLTNEHVNLCEIWNESGNAWIVAGFIHEQRFEIKISENKEGHPTLTIKHIYDEEDRLSEEIREIAVRFRDWYEEQYTGETLHYSANALLCFPEKMQTQLREKEIKTDDFSSSAVKDLKNQGFLTIDDFLQRSKEELERVLDFSTVLELHGFKRRAENCLKNPVYHIFGVPKPTLREKYPIALDIPLEETDLDEDIVYSLEREGHRTIADVLTIPKDLFPILYYDIDDEEVEEIEKMLAGFGFQLDPYKKK